LEIPLLVGEVRSCEDHSGGNCYAVDAVFNPWVMENSEENNTFKAQVIDLAIQWVEQEVCEFCSVIFYTIFDTTVSNYIPLLTFCSIITFLYFPNLSLYQTKYKFEKQWKTIKSKYKGGLGEENTIPMPFPIDRALQQSDPIEERKETSGMDSDKHASPTGMTPKGLSTPSPESLLRATMNTNDPITENHIKMPGDKSLSNNSNNSNSSQAPRKPLIEEVKPKVKAKPAVKKGFLQGKEGKEVPRLYDENGSSGDGSKEV
jgi:hypothetical protein